MYIEFLETLSPSQESPEIVFRLALIYLNSFLLLLYLGCLECSFCNKNYVSLEVELPEAYSLALASEGIRGLCCRKRVRRGE